MSLLALHVGVGTQGPVFGFEFRDSLDPKEPTFFFFFWGGEVLILISFYKSLKGKYLRVQVRVEECELRG